MLRSHRCRAQTGRLFTSTQIFASEKQLGIWLAKQEKLRRDAAMLATLALVLLADFSFFYTQAAMLKLTSAGPFSLFGAAQSLLIADILLRGFEVQLSRPTRLLLAIDFCAVHLFPL